MSSGRDYEVKKLLTVGALGGVVFQLAHNHTFVLKISEICLNHHYCSER